MIISVAVFVYSTVTYYRYQRWEEYLTIVDYIRRNSQKVLRIGLANFTQNFLEGTVRNKEEYEAYTLRGLFSSWERDLQKIYAGIGVDLEFNAVGNRLIASKWTVNDNSHIIKCFWYNPDSISSACANLSIALFSYGFYGYHTILEEYLRLQVDTSYIDMNKSKIQSLNVIVTKENENPCFGLTDSNFEVIWFNNETNSWDEASIANVTYKESGRYTLNFTNPIPKPYYKWLFISVTDQRGIVTVCSTYSYIEFTVERETPNTLPDDRLRYTDDEVYTLEAGINGTWYWNGVKLGVKGNVTPPIPPIPIRLFRVNITENGVGSDWTISPCQYEIWDKVSWHGQLIDVPRNLADPNWPFNSSNRIVFQVAFPNLIENQSVRIWWENDLDASPYQAESDLQYIEGAWKALTNYYEIEFIGVNHTKSASYPVDYHGVAALLVKDPKTHFCFGPWNIHAFNIHYYYYWSGWQLRSLGLLEELRPYGNWEIKYWYPNRPEMKAVVRLIAILNSTKVQCHYNYEYPSHENGPFDNYYDTLAVVFITANVKYLQLNVHVYWKENCTGEGLWFAAVMGGGKPKNFAYQRYEGGIYVSDYDYSDPSYEENENHGSGQPMIPGYWIAHWNETVGRAIIINQKGLQCLRSFNPNRTRFSITEFSIKGFQGSLELQALNYPNGPDTINAGTSYSYTLAMWIYDGGGYEEINNYYVMFLEDYSPKIVVEG